MNPPWSQLTADYRRLNRVRRDGAHVGRRREEREGDIVGSSADARGAHADTTTTVVRPILTLSPFFSRWDW